mgnify:FL=1
MKKTNTNFLRSILLASLLLASYISQAQMYPFKSAERVVNLSAGNLKNLLVRTIDESNLLTSCKVAVGTSIVAILHTDDGGNIRYAIIHGIAHISDLRVLDGYVLFSGMTANSEGFIAYTEIEELFDPSLGNLDIYIIPGIKDINRVNAYMDVDEYSHVVAIGDEQHFINFLTEIDYAHVHSTNYTLLDFAFTDNRIVILGRTSSNRIALFSHEKTYPDYYLGCIYSHDPVRFENFLIEELTGDNVLVSYTDRPDGYQAQFVQIDATSLQPIAQQSLLNAGKPNSKAMVFNPAKATVLYLAHAVSNKDMIAFIKPDSSNSYMSNIIIPNMCRWGDDTFNSLTDYRDSYLSAVGKDTTSGNLYWFDYDYTQGNSPGNCFGTMQENVIMSNTFFISGSEYYPSGFVLQPQTQTVNVYHSGSPYNIICND